MSVITILSCFNNDRAKEKLGELLMPSDESRNSALPEYLAEDFQIAWDELREEYRENGYGSNFLDFLKQIYLLLGSSQYLLVNSALGEDQRYQELEALAYYFGVPLADEGIPSKDGFLEIYSKLSEENINQIAQELAKDYECEFSESREQLIEVLRYLRPLAKDLKEDASSLLVVMHDYLFPELLPKESDQIINSEVKKFFAAHRDSENFKKFLS